MLYRIDRWRGMAAAGTFAARQDGKMTRWATRDGMEFYSYGFMLADYPGLIVAYRCVTERLPLVSDALRRIISADKQTRREAERRQLKFA